MGDIRVRDIEEAEVHVRSLWINVEQLAGRVSTLEKKIDSHGSPWWKRILFRLDGWPAWWVVGREPDPRPWRRWWRS